MARPKLPAFVDLADAQRRTRSVCDAWHEERFEARFARAAVLGPEMVTKRARRDELERKTALALRAIEDLAATIESTPHDARGFLATQLVKRAGSLRELGDGVVKPADDSGLTDLERFVAQTDHAHRHTGGQTERLADSELAKLAILLGHWPDSAWQQCKNEDDVIAAVAKEIEAARSRRGTLKTPGKR